MPYGGGNDVPAEHAAVSQSTAVTFPSSMEPMTTTPLRVATERPNSIPDPDTGVTSATEFHAVPTRAYTRATSAT